MSIGRLPKVMEVLIGGWFSLYFFPL